MSKRLSLDKGKKKKNKGSCKREFTELKIFLFCRQYLCNIILSLLKYRDVGAFQNYENEESKQGKPLK